MQRNYSDYCSFAPPEQRRRGQKTKTQPRSRRPAVSPLPARYFMVDEEDEKHMCRECGILYFHLVSCPLNFEAARELAEYARIEEEERKSSELGNLNLTTYKDQWLPRNTKLPSSAVDSFGKENNCVVSSQGSSDENDKLTKIAEVKLCQFPEIQTIEDEEKNEELDEVNRVYDAKEDNCYDGTKGAFTVNDGEFIPNNHIGEFEISYEQRQNGRILGHKEEEGKASGIVSILSGDFENGTTFSSEAAVFSPPDLAVHGETLPSPCDTTNSMSGKTGSNVETTKPAEWHRKLLQSMKVTESYESGCSEPKVNEEEREEDYEIKKKKCSHSRGKKLVGHRINCVVNVDKNLGKKRKEKSHRAETVKEMIRRKKRFREGERGNERMRKGDINKQRIRKRERDKKKIRKAARNEEKMTLKQTGCQRNWWKPPKKLTPMLKENSGYLERWPVNYMTESNETYLGSRQGKTVQYSRLTGKRLETQEAEDSISGRRSRTDAGKRGKYPGLGYEIGIPRNPAG